jgi:hypothetical protein
LRKIELNSNQLDQFAREGFLVIRSFYETTAIEAVQRGIYDLIGRGIAKNRLNIDRKPFQSLRLMTDLMQ